MQCPRCHHDGSSVKDSRPSALTVRRRRQCDSCGEIFTTQETVMPAEDVVGGRLVKALDEWLARRLKEAQP